jgi:D-alanyl-D-alanine carboxypeptidase (penicillin-binding protein 5/6)
MKVTAVLDEPIAAPVKKDSVVGKLVVTAPGVTPIEVPLLAGADVEQLGFFSRIGAAVNHILFGPPQQQKVASR